MVADHLKRETTTVPPTQFDRYATITIQGGGVYGLNLLGQLATLVDELDIIPVALAGNSAGAIIATLYWAGLDPESIKENFKEASAVDPVRGRGQLMDLLGPFDRMDAEAFDFEKFLDMKHRFEGYLATLDAQLSTDEGPRGPGWAERLIRWIETPCRNLSAIVQLWRARNDVAPHGKNKGLFQGDLFEKTIDRWIRESPDIKEAAGKPRAKGLLPPPPGSPGGRLLTFGDIEALQVCTTLLLPPLFLTATNLSLRRLEVISSFEPRYAHWPIATAVRASAGFPVFFRPVAVKGRPVGSWYVDGGLISNFPSWVFGPKFRSSLANDHSLDYSYFSSFPWLNIGLRVLDDGGAQAREDATIGQGPYPEPVPPHPLKPKEFLDSLVALVTGGARNEIEGILSTFVSRSRTVLQPISETSGPENLLAFHQIDADRVQAMYDSGRLAARGSFADVDYRLPGPEDQARVVDLLATMADRAWAILQPPGIVVPADRIFRASVYLSQGEKLCPWCAWNMDGAADKDLEFELGSGLTGFCHARRRPLLGNLEMIADEYRAGSLDAVHYFRMQSIQQDQVAHDRTWLASFPIFDPGDIGLHQAPSAPEEAKRPYLCEVNSPIAAGGVFGVLNLDGAIDYTAIALPPEPALNLTDRRVASIIAIMQSVSFEVGQILSASYPSSSIL